MNPIDEPTVNTLRQRLLDRRAQLLDELRATRQASAAMAERDPAEVGRGLFGARSLAGGNLW